MLCGETAYYNDINKKYGKYLDTIVIKIDNFELKNTGFKNEYYIYVNDEIIQNALLKNISREDIKECYIKICLYQSNAYHRHKTNGFARHFYYLNVYLFINKESFVMKLNRFYDEHELYNTTSEYLKENFNIDYLNIAKEFNLAVFKTILKLENTKYKSAVDFLIRKEIKETQKYFSYNTLEKSLKSLLSNNYITLKNKKYNYYNTTSKGIERLKIVDN